MKRVFANDMVAHVWAQQSQPEGRSNNGNFSFSHGTLYSYSTPIANIVSAVDGTNVALVTCESYSPTTAGKHKAPAYHALRGNMPVFTVPFLGASGGRAFRHPDSNNMREVHAGNLAYLNQGYEKLRGRLIRARDLYVDINAALRDAADEVRRYAAAFGIDAPAIDWERDADMIQTARAAREAKNRDPKIIAQREREAERRATRKQEKEEAERAAKVERDREAIAEWRMGGGYRVGYWRDAEGGALLRVKDGALETSLGASVPLAHAVRVFRLVAACRAKGETWQANGHQIAVGHFHVSRINPDGSFIAGCHLINWPEIENAARVAGVLENGGN